MLPVLPVLPVGTVGTFRQITKFKTGGVPFICPQSIKYSILFRPFEKKTIQTSLINFLQRTDQIASLSQCYPCYQ